MDRNDRTDREVTLGGVALAPGDHLCVFHRGRADRDRLLIPFLTEGMGAGDAVLYLAAVGERENIRERPAHAGDLLLTEPGSGQVWTAGTLVENPCYLSSTEDGHHPGFERRIPS